MVLVSWDCTHLCEHVDTCRSCRCSTQQQLGPATRSRKREVMEGVTGTLYKINEFLLLRNVHVGVPRLVVDIPVLGGF